MNFSHTGSVFALKQNYYFFLYSGKYKDWEILSYFLTSPCLCRNAGNIQSYWKLKLVLMLQQFSQSQLALLHTLCGPVLALLTTCLFYAIIQQTVTAALNFWINRDTLAYISWLCEDPRVCSLFFDFWKFEGWCVIVLSLRFMLLLYF